MGDFFLSPWNPFDQTGAVWTCASISVLDDEQGTSLHTI